jgi:DNA-binding HxlR family transcriptional regulator
VRSPHDDATKTCPVARAIDVLQEKWMLSIVHALLKRPRRFNELGREVVGPNPTTLRQRLGRLESFGLVSRHCEDTETHYALTSSGEALKDVIDAIQRWSVVHLHHADGHVTERRMQGVGSAPQKEAEA